MNVKSHKTLQTHIGMLMNLNFNRLESRPIILLSLFRHYIKKIVGYLIKPKLEIDIGISMKMRQQMQMFWWFELRGGQKIHREKESKRKMYAD